MGCLMRVKMRKLDEFRRKALECRRRAEDARGLEEKHAWLKLADDWDELAQGEYLEKDWKGLLALRAIIEKRNRA